MPSKAVLDRAEDVYQAMKKNRKNIVKRYGKEAENVMRGRSMNIAKNQVKTMNEDKLKEIIKKKLSTKPEPKEMEEGKAGRVLGGLALFAALMAGNKALLDADPRMEKLKTAYEQAEKTGDTARMEKIKDAITKQEIYLSTGQGEEQSIDEKKAKPDFLDLDKDGDKEEPMKKAAKEKKDDSSLEEEKMTKGEKKEKERIVKGMKKNKKDFEKRYPGRGEQVMYATATNKAMEK